MIYQIADHLGSVRVIKDGEGTVLQRFDYYPFGSESRVWAAGTNTPQSVLRYRFDGKEIAGQKVGASVSQNGTPSAPAGTPAAAAGRPYLDFGARLYDPRTAAWLSQDPLSEKYYPVSPYAYCAGNPVNLVDDSGESPHIIIGAIIGGVVNGGVALYQGKTGRELLGAVAGGAMFGAITAASGGANLLTSAGYGLAGGIASSITEQVIGEGSVDIGQVVVGGVSGAAAGAISSAAGSVIEKTSTKAIQAIDRKYASQSVQNEIQNEVKKEFRNVGRSFGKSTNRELNTSVAERIETLSGTDKTVVKALSSTIDKAQGEIVGWGMEELTKWTYERIQNE